MRLLLLIIIIILLRVKPPLNTNDNRISIQADVYPVSPNLTDCQSPRELSSSTRHRRQHVWAGDIPRGAQVLIFKIGHFKAKKVCFGVPLVTHPSRSHPSAHRQPRAAHFDPNYTRSTKENPESIVIFVGNTTKHIPIVTSCLFHRCAQAIRWRSHSWRGCWWLTSRVPRVLKTAPTTSTRRKTRRSALRTFARCGRNRHFANRP